MAAAALFMGGGVLLANWQQNRLQKKIQQWPMTEATIEGGTFETIPGAGRRTLEPMKAPVLGFSYHVNGEYYSGKIAMMQFFNDDGAEIIHRMSLKKLEIYYDPQDATRWYYNDSTLAGCIIRQEGLRSEENRSF